MLFVTIVTIGLFHTPLLYETDDGFYALKQALKSDFTV
jgi:hypothetical protein